MLVGLLTYICVTQPQGVKWVAIPWNHLHKHTIQNFQSVMAERNIRSAIYGISEGQRHTLTLLWSNKKQQKTAMYFNNILKIWTPWQYTPYYGPWDVNITSICVHTPKNRETCVMILSKFMTYTVGAYSFSPAGATITMMPPDIKPYHCSYVNLHDFQKPYLINDLDKHVIVLLVVIITAGDFQDCKGLYHYKLGTPHGAQK